MTFPYAPDSEPQARAVVNDLRQTCGGFLVCDGALTHSEWSSAKGWGYLLVPVIATFSVVRGVRAVPINCVGYLAWVVFGRLACLYLSGIVTDDA